MLPNDAPPPPPPVFGEDESAILSSAHPPALRQPPPLTGAPPTAKTPRPHPAWQAWAPVVVLLAGIIGVAVFAGLTYKKARDDLNTAQLELTELRQDRDGLVAERDEAGRRAEEAERQRKAVEGQLTVAQRAALEAKEKVATAGEKLGELEGKLNELVGEKEGEVERDGERLTLKLVDRVLFKSGESELTKNGQRVLRKVGAALKGFKDKQVWVQGHTDAVPIGKSNPRFGSNWELSAARALTVVHFLEDEVGISGKRLAAVAFSKYRPVTRKRKDKKKNRRIEIVLFPQAVEVIRD